MIQLDVFRKRQGVMQGLGLGRFLSLIAVCMAAGLSFGAGCSSCGGGGSDDSGGGGGGQQSMGSVRGSLTLPARVLLDSDTPDPHNLYIANDFPGQAQGIADLVSVIGYADQILDPDDYFACPLTMGEKVVLRIADSATDLDLYLYQGPTLVASSTATGPVETVTVPADDDYYIRVHAFNNGSIYNLGTGVTGAGVPAGPAGSAWSVDDEFVPGEAVVRFKTTGPGAMRQKRSSLRPAAEAEAQRMGIALAAVDPGGLARVLFDAGPSQKQLPTLTPAAGTGRLSERQAKQATLEKIRELSRDPAVAYAEPNFILRPTLDAHDTYRYLQWNLDLIRLPMAWDNTVGDASVIVAVVDTGVLYNHPDLNANILKDGTTVVGYDMISDPTVANDGNGHDSNPIDSGDLVNGSKSSFHGTHVAGIIAAVTDNNKGVAGVSWNTKIMPVRVLGKGGGTSYDVAQGILFAAARTNAYGVFPKKGGVNTPADIINMSLGSEDFSQAVQDAVNSARAAGVIVIAAAGNESTSQLFYPAADAGVVGVSAVDYAGKLAYYSNYGTYVDIAAPGGDLTADLYGDGNEDGILSTLGDGATPGSVVYNYVMYQGTSMAAPHIAGVVALMKAAYIVAGKSPADLTPEILDDLIKGNTVSDKINDSITDYTRRHRDNNKGYGLIDADKAVLAALTLAGATVSSTPRLALQPSDLAFGLLTNQLTTHVTDRGLEPLQGVTVVPYSEPWLTHSLSGSSLVFTVNRAALADGSYSANVTVSSLNGGTDNAFITLLKQANLASDVGAVYVILYNIVTQETVNQDIIDAANLYAYAMTNIISGSFILAAGTDLNNDNYLGDNGELFGIYPSLDQPSPFLVSNNQDLTGYNFTLQSMGLPPAAAAGPLPPGLPTKFKRLDVNK